MKVFLIVLQRNFQAVSGIADRRDKESKQNSLPFLQDHQCKVKNLLKN